MNSSGATPDSRFWPRVVSIAMAATVLGCVADFALTVDGIWDALLAARAKNELNSATFGRRGVPAEVDTGPWAIDGGMHYSVRNFAATQ